MALLSYFARIAQKYGMPDGVIVDQVTEDSPILETALWQPSNNGMTHKYAEIKDIVAMQAVNRNSTYPTVGADRKIDNKDLTLYAGTQEVHVNTAAEWGEDGAGASAYFDDQKNDITRQTFADIETDVIYNENRGFEVNSKAFGTLKTINATDVSADSYYSLYVVGWSQGNMSMLYNEKGFASAGVIKETALNGGNRYKNSSDQSVYGLDMEIPVGLFPVNGRNIGGLANFQLSDIDADFYKKLNDAITLVRGGNKFIYAHPLVIQRLMQAEESYTLSNGDNGVFRKMWVDNTMVGSYNFLQGTEAFISGLETA